VPARPSLPSIRAKIAVLVLACALPTAIGFTGLVHHFYERERDHARFDVRQTAHVVALAVDRELDIGSTALRALAGSPALASGDLAAFYRQAAALLGPDFPVGAFILTDGEGRQLINTLRPYGSALPLRGNLEQVRRVFSDGRLVVSSVYTGNISRQHQLAVDLPVWRDGKVAYALGMTITPEKIGELLLHQHLPPAAVINVVDSQGVLVARTLSPEKYIGQPIVADTWRQMRQADEGVIHIRSFEGVAMYAGYSRAPHSGWSVSIGMPEATVLSELLDSVSGLTAAVAALMLAGFALAWYVGGGIRRSVKALALAADALADGPATDGAAQPATFDFREAEEVAVDLRRLAVEAQRYRLELEALVAERTAQLNESNVLLQSVYATAPVGLCQVDADLRFVAINDYLAAIDGRSVEEHIGQRLSSLIGAVGMEVEALYRRVLDSGEALVGLELSGQVASAPGETRYWNASYYPVRSADGRVVGVTGVVLDVSERKRMETRLRDSEEYFRVLYESSRDAHLLLAPHGSFTGANQAAVALFGGADLRALLALSPAAASPEFQPDGQRSAVKAQQMMQQAVDHGWHSFEWVHRRQDGSTFHADVLLAAIHIGGERILQATVRDIDERKRTEMALRQSRMLLKSILENMPAMIFAKTAAGLRYEIFNHSAEQFLGHARAAVLGKTDRELFPPAQAEQMMLTDYRVLAAPSFVETELQPLTNASGDTRYFTMRQVALRNDNGSATHILGVGIDVTERKQAQERLSATSTQLERNERFIRTITDSLPGMVGYWDAGRRCRFANKRYLEWYGRSQEEIGQITLEELLGDGYAVSQPHLDGVMEGRPQTFERAMRLPDGALMHSWVSYLPDLDDDDVVRGFFVLISDITALKQSELRLQSLNEELVRARDRAEAASSAKSEFLANMSHEIRTPMNAIIGLARLLEEAPLERRERSYVAKIKLATQSLLGVLNDVLDFSKIEAGRLALEHAPFSLDRVLGDTAVLVTANAWAKGVEPVFAVAADVPLVLTGDAMRLQQVLLNLIGNAVKFTERGEVVLSIKRAEQDGRRITLGFSVRDSGIGIAAAQQESMFDAFSQGDSSTSRKYGGAGLGLAICRRLVGLMGGSIDVRSAPGAGSTFHFTAVFELDAADGASALLQAPAEDELRGLSILIVDDNASARAALFEACTALGWTCDLAAGGAEALALLQHRARRWPAPPEPGERYDLMLLDSAMPGLDGISMLMQARADQRLAVPPVVMLVADNASENLQRIADGLQIGAILTKPTTPSRVLAAVASLRRGAPLGAAPAVPLPTPLSGRLAGLRILLVEDNEINQEVAQYILLHAGARVDIAGHGALALDMLQAATEPYDAVLMDLQMPVMNGYQATRAIRAMGLTLPVIAMTANAMPEDRERAIECGMDAHIAKPIEVDDLIATLTRLAPPSGAAAAGASAPDGLPAQLPGIDLKAALQRFGGNYAAFAALLRRFENSQGDAVREARRLIDAGERQAATQMLHRLRGVAANLGANDVATYASTAETALRGGQQVELNALLDALDAAMSLVFASARALPMTASAVNSNATGVANLTQGGGAAEDLPLALAQLRALLQNSNMKALTAFHALQPQLELVEREAALALADAVETLSFAEAERLVQQLLQGMEGNEKG
jgi:PAS domain S-box-containing protein